MTSIDWAAISAVGTWFCGIATVAAVWVALRESSRAYKPKARGTASLNTTAMWSDGVETRSDYPQLNFVNIGACKIAVKGVTLRRAGYAELYIPIDDGYADNRPFRVVEPGEEIERSWSMKRFRMTPSSNSQLASFVRNTIDAPYVIEVTDTLGRRYGIATSRALQERLRRLQETEDPGDN